MTDADTFQFSVSKHFKFLEKYGFVGPNVRECTEFDCVISYSSQTVYICLTYGSPEYEPSITFSLNSSTKPPFTLGNLMHIGQDSKLWQATTGTEGIESWVSWLASAIHSVETPLCTGNAAFYERLATHADSRLEEYLKNEKLHSLRTIAEKAWHEKDFKKVASTYRLFLDNLTILETKRLKYAEKSKST